MAEKKKKKQPKGMPRGSVQSRIPSRAATGKAGKKSLMPGLTGAVKASKARRKKRKSKVKKYVSGVKERVLKYHAGKGQARAEKVLTKMGISAEYPYGGAPSKSKKAKAKPKPKKAKTSVFHLKKGTKVRKGAVGVKKTKGGEYVKYGKKSEAAGSFRKAFKSGCAGGAKSFKWDGRSYSCKKK